MNQSTIITMLTADPTILNDVPGFVSRMNAQTISQTVTQPVVVQQAVQVMTSVAEINGGLTTEAEVLAAQNLIAAQPHLDTTEQLSALLTAAFASGDKAQMVDALTQSQAAISNTLAQLES